MGRGKPQKVKLSPIQREIMLYLEDFGRDDAVTVLNTFAARFEDISLDRLYDDVIESLRGLAEREWVRATREYREPSKPPVYEWIPFEEFSGIMRKTVAPRKDIASHRWETVSDDAMRMHLEITDAGRKAVFV